MRFGFEKRYCPVVVNLMIIGTVVLLTAFSGVAQALAASDKALDTGVKINALELVSAPAPHSDRLPFLKQIQLRKVSEKEEKVEFIFDGLRPPRVFFTRTGPLRVVCDFADVLADRKIPMIDEVDGRLVQTLRLGLHGKERTDARVVLDLVPGLEYELAHIFVRGKIYILIVRNVL